VKIHTLRIRRNGFGNFREISNGHNFIVSNRNSGGVRILRITRKNLGIKKYPLHCHYPVPELGSPEDRTARGQLKRTQIEQNKPESIHEIIILSLPIESGTCI